MWTNFVKFGHPTPAQADMGYTWEPVTAGDIRSWLYLVMLYVQSVIRYLYFLFSRYLAIDREMKMDMDDDFIDRMQFWDSLNITLN